MCEHFIAKYDYPLLSTGEWTGNVRWWPGSKWLFDQEQKQLQREAVGDEGAEPSLVSSVSSAGSVANEENAVQPLLPLASKRKIAVTNLYESRARSFYEQLGQQRPSRQQIRAGAEVLHSLVEQQGYSWDDLDFTLEWIMGHLSTRFNGRVQSIGIIPHVIGEALQGKALHERRQDRTRAQQQEERKEQEQAAQSKKLWEAIEHLPETEKEILRNKAVTNLLDQGYQRQFIRDTLIKIEMARLVEQDLK